METILLVDVDSDRADLICKMLTENEVRASRCANVAEVLEEIESVHRPAVIVVHCELVHNAFTELAKLVHHPNVKLIFYCTDAEERSPGTVTKLPEDLGEIILKITESARLLKQAS
jgi:DNA-binding response OmpR family regulator